MDANQNKAYAPKILILEQDEYLASLLHLLLSREGYLITAITDPEQALQYIRTFAAAHLVFIDQSWLLESDPKILDALRSQAEWQSTPMVALLNVFNQDNIDRLATNGIDNYLAQPFDPNELLDLIQANLRQALQAE